MSSCCKASTGGTSPPSSAAPSSGTRATATSPSWGCRTRPATEPPSATSISAPGRCAGYRRCPPLHHVRSGLSRPHGGAGGRQPRGRLRGFQDRRGHAAPALGARQERDRRRCRMPHADQGPSEPDHGAHHGRDHVRDRQPHRGRLSRIASRRAIAPAGGAKSSEGWSCMPGAWSRDRHDHAVAPPSPSGAGTPRNRAVDLDLTEMGESTGGDEVCESTGQARRLGFNSTTVLCSLISEGEWRTDLSNLLAD